jgi:thiamine biosynthesis lipoprotein ApbE
LKDASDIVRLNAAADEPPCRSRRRRATLHIARQISEQTHGTAFDITFAALSGPEIDYRDKDEVDSDRKEIEKRLPLVNYRDVLSTTPPAQRCSAAGASVNLGGIGGATPSIARSASCAGAASAIS